MMAARTTDADAPDASTNISTTTSDIENETRRPNLPTAAATDETMIVMLNPETATMWLVPVALKSSTTLLGKPLRYRLEPGDVTRPGYDCRYSIDGSKLLASGWEPPRSFLEALEATVRWTADHPEWVGLAA